MAHVPVLTKSILKLPNRAIVGWFDHGQKKLYLARVGNAFDYYLKSLGQIKYGSFKNEYVRDNGGALEFRVVENFANTYLLPYQVYRHQYWHTYYKSLGYTILSEYPEFEMSKRMEVTSSGYELFLVAGKKEYPFKTYHNPEQWSKIGKKVSVDEMVELLNNRYKPDDLPEFEGQE